MGKLHRFFIGLPLLGGSTRSAPSAKLAANPTVVCPGRAVRLVWEGSSAGVLTSEPASPESSGPGEVGASGSKTVHPRTSTTYRFEVGSVFAKRAVATTVRVPEAPKDGVRVAPSGGAEDGVECLGDRIRATAHVPAASWDARLRVDVVTSADGRSYQVSHQVARRVGRGLGGLRDLPLAGAWTLETALRPGEDCGADPPGRSSIRSA